MCQPDIGCKGCILTPGQEAKIGRLMRKRKVELVGVACGFRLARTAVADMAGPTIVVGCREGVMIVQAYGMGTFLLSVEG